MIEYMGATNIYADASNHYPRPNLEDIIHRNPDIIIICPMSNDDKSVKQAIQSWNRFKKLKAVQNKQIHTVTLDWLTKPTFTLEHGIQALEKIL